MSGTVLVVAGGARPDPLAVNALPEIDFCIAADGGGDHALELGMDIGAIVGDMDSVSAACLAGLRAAGVEVQEHSAVKDRTDLELALQRAMEEKPDLVIVIGIAGGRLDHALANIAVLASDEYRQAPIDALIGSARVSVIRGIRELSGVLGETVTLLAVNGPVTGVTTQGLQFPLADEPLHAGSARGVSNRFVATTATVTIRDGVLLSVQPFALKERSAG